MLRFRHRGHHRYNSVRIVIEPARLLFEIFSSDILPVFLVAAVGFLLARHARVDVRALSRVSLHGLAPMLMFHLLITSHISGDMFGRVALLCLIVTASMGALGSLAALLLRLDRQTRIGLLLVVMFSNGGNYGLPVALFAFGREALAYATVYFVTGGVLTYTVGVSLAASGRSSLRTALGGVARIPAVYGVIAAGLVLSSGRTIPEPLMKAVELLSDAALPVMMLVLGMQLERAVMPRHLSAVAAAAVLSLLISPLLALGSAHLVGLTGPALQASVVQASMPTAVVTTIIALEYDAEPAFVTSVVVATTALSPLTLTLLIAYLQRVSG
jgi:predicted permease